ncbi:MAG: hypothetical protein CEE43_04895 [Promethearchaeota archaeon Loki_b32]|nr:MAG: hypothetical protein CEE43_04895 [Candidatus Lokiarchaeota archaeon Loki_b32]
MKKITENIDLKEIEKKSWRSTFEDGILDIYFGILVLGIGMGMTLSPVVPNPFDKFIPFIFIGIGLAFFLTTKKFITQPRLGVVKFGLKRKGRKLKTLIMLSINFIILLILFLIRFINPELSLDFPGYLEGLILGLLFITAPICFAAYFIQYSRFYFIGLLVGLSFFLSDLFSIFIPEPFDTLIVFSIVSGAIIAMGIISLIKFIRKYPLSKEEMT